MEDHTWAHLRSGVVFEDDDLIVLDKPAGISVTGERHGADIDSLANQAGENVMPAHRIDKATSGLVIFTKTRSAHADLARAFAARSVEKRYLAVVRGSIPESGNIDLPLSVGRKNRVRVAGPRDAIYFDEDRDLWCLRAPPPAQGGIYPAQSHWLRLASTEGEDPHSLIMVRPTTGRRHQIRVHLAWIGFPICNDRLFDKTATARLALHSTAMRIPPAGARMESGRFLVSPGADFVDLWTRQVNPAPAGGSADPHGEPHSNPDPADIWMQTVADSLDGPVTE